jgi:hypothetical protein
MLPLIYYAVFIIALDFRYAAQARRKRDGRQRAADTRGALWRDTRVYEKEEAEKKERGKR